MLRLRGERRRAYCEIRNCPMNPILCATDQYLNHATESFSDKSIEGSMESMQASLPIGTRDHILSYFSYI